MLLKIKNCETLRELLLLQHKQGYSEIPHTIPLITKMILRVLLLLNFINKKTGKSSLFHTREVIPHPHSRICSKKYSKTEKNVCCMFIYPNFKLLEFKMNNAIRTQ
jgi:hypothetical protein